MDSKIAEQILDELAPTFEALESQSAALMQFLKEKGIASDEQLAPYLEQAAAASSVRWRALRVRMGRLFSMAEKSEDEARNKEKREVKTRKETAAEAQGAETKGTQADTQRADAKKDKPDHTHDLAGSKERAGADQANIEQASAEQRPEAAKSTDVKEPAQKEPTVPARSEETRSRQDEAPNAPKKKDAA